MGEWGVGLILSGLFLAIMVLKVGTARFREKYLNPNATSFKIGKWFTPLIYLILFEGIVLLGWWLIKGGSPVLAAWCLAQWGALILVLILFERKLIGRMFPEDS